MAIASFCDYCGAENTPGETLCHACQHPLAQPAPLEESGTLLNERYALISEIGAGGFGAVYKARDTHDKDRLVAVKGINLQGLTAQEIIEATDAFNREAEILSMLSHPLLPRIFDRFSDPEHWYLVMTYIDGETLDEYLQNHRVSSLPAVAGLPLGETLEIALQLCDALHYLHNQQPAVIFRDLKPGNIMRTRKGQLYLIDFGIARRFKPGQAKDTIPFGSPGFAAPEQYGRAQTTPQADIYSLGALLSCLLTSDDPSEHPFDFPPLHQYGIDGIRELNALIQRMIALDPTKRPTDIPAVQAELRHIQQLNTKANQQNHIWTPPQGQTPPADGGGQKHIFLNPSVARQQQMRKVTRRRVVTTSLVLGSVAALGGIIALASQSSPGQSQPASSGDYTYQPTADTQDPQPTAAATQATNALQDGTAFWSSDLSYAAVMNQNLSQIEIYKAQSQQVTQNIKSPNDLTSSLHSVWWSPDNSKFLAQSTSGMMYAWNPANGQQLFTFTKAVAGYSPSVPPTVAWSPDGQVCAISYHEQNNDINLVLLRANDGQQIFQKQLPSANGIIWSPDNRYFAFPDAQAWPEGQAWSASIWVRGTFQKIGSISGVLPANPYGETPYTLTFLTSAWSPDGKYIATLFGNNSTDTDNLSLFVSQPDNGKPAISFPHITSTDIDITALTYTSAWSPDEKYLAVYEPNNLIILNILAEQQVSLNDNFPQGSIKAFAWAANSQSINVVNTFDSTISGWSVVPPH